MARDLQLRLIFTYCAVALAALVLLGSVFTAVLATSVSAAHVRDMRAETASLATQLERALAGGARRAAIQHLITRDSALLGKRIILVDRQGQVRYDSARWTPFSRGSWRMVDLTALQHGQWASLQGNGRFGLQSPLLVGGREVGAVALVVTSADTGIPWGQIAIPLLGVLLALLLVGLAIAAILARSLSRPLRHVSAGMMSVKQGEYDRSIPEEGWSEARLLARHYNEMVAEVARSRQLQRDFVANAAHELKTPVTLIAGFARSLVDGTARRDGAEGDAVRYIQTESEHLGRVVEQLFTLASLDAEVAAQHPVPCHPAALVRRTNSRFNALALARGVRLELSLGTDVPECWWDEEWIVSALTNLIGNALEHSPSSGAVVTRGRRDGSTVILEVEDNGDGITPADLPHIFDRFYRGQGRRVNGHAGLGLALVREVVERHGGTMSVRTQVGEGTRFIVALPIRAPIARRVGASEAGGMTA